MRRIRKWTPKEKRDEVVLMYLSGENSVEELGEYYNVNPATIRTWIKRKKKEAEKSSEVALLEARIRELELQNLALNTLIDVAERNGIEIRKKSGAKQ